MRRARGESKVAGDEAEALLRVLAETSWRLLYADGVLLQLSYGRFCQAFGHANFIA